MGRPRKDPAMLAGPIALRKARPAAELTKIQKGLKSLTPEAVATLRECMNSEDEKIRLRAAELVLQYQVAISKEAADNAFKHMMLEMRNGAAGINSNPQAPKIVVDFTQVQEIE